MMYTILVILLVLVLSIAGFLAYQNSKLVFNQKKFGALAHNPLLLYSIIDEASTARMENPDVIPLFQYSVFVEKDRTVAVCEPIANLVLCRVAAGEGDFVLAEANKTMLEHIKGVIPMNTNTFSEYSVYLHRAVSHAEKEMILNIEDVVKLQYT